MIPRGSEALKQSHHRVMSAARFSPVSSSRSKTPNTFAATSFFPGTLPVRLHLRSDLHLMRKTWHMVMGCLIAFIYLSGMQTSTAVTILGSVLGLALLVEAARLKLPAFNEKVVRVWSPFMRENELKRMSGMPYYIAASLLAIAIFPKPVAILSILYLACGDPIASLFGIVYGHKSIRLTSGKSLIGTAAGVITCAIVTFVFLKAIAVSGPALFVLPIVGGLAGGMAELLPIDIDDNFTIPVASGFVLWLAFIIAGI
jgi:dolichol kinase